MGRRTCRTHRKSFRHSSAKVAKTGSTGPSNGVRTARDGRGTRFKLWDRCSVLPERCAPMTHVDIPADAGDFRLLSRRAVDALRAPCPSGARFLRGMTSWVGFPSGLPSPTRREARYAGKT